MRVLIVGPPDSRGALAAVRSLRRAGWVVGLGAPVRGPMVGRSRALSRWHPLPDPCGGHDAFGHALSAVVRAEGYEVVLAAGDAWLVALSRVRERLRAAVPYPPAGRLEAALDKVRLAQLAGAAGLRTPRTQPATPESLAGWSGPAVVKPRHHRGGDPVPAVVVPDAAAAGRRAEQVRALGAEPVVQEPITGTLVALTTLVDREGRTVARVQQRADRLWPTPAGVSARATSVPVDAALADRVDQLLAALDWVGLAQVQLLDTAEGPVLIDLNARFYGSLGLAIAAGVDLPDLWARVATGRPVPAAPPAAVGVRYSWLEGDLRRALVERRGGLAPDLASSLAWGFRASHSITSASDPVPALAYAGHLARRGVHKLARGGSR